MPVIITIAQSGGVQPSLRQPIRALQMRSLFKSRQATVARPIGVNPMITEPSSD